MPRESRVDRAEILTSRSSRHPAPSILARSASDRMVDDVFHLPRDRRGARSGSDPGPLATLASAATSSGAAVVNRRNEVASAIDELVISMVVTLTVGIAATLVTAGGSDLVAAGSPLRGSRRQADESTT